MYSLYTIHIIHDLPDMPIMPILSKWKVACHITQIIQYTCGTILHCIKIGNNFLPKIEQIVIEKILGTLVQWLFSQRLMTFLWQLLSNFHLISFSLLLKHIEQRCCLQKILGNTSKRETENTAFLIGGVVTGHVSYIRAAGRGDNSVRN